MFTKHIKQSTALTTSEVQAEPQQDNHFTQLFNTDSPKCCQVCGMIWISSYR